MRYRHEEAGLDLSENEAFKLWNEELEGTIKYPRNWFRNSTEKEISDLGFEAYEPEPVEPTPPSDDPKDHSLTAVQFHAMVSILGLTEAQILAAIDAGVSDPVLKAVVTQKYLRGQIFNREDEMFTLLGPALGLTQEQIDVAWMQAKAIG